MASGSTPHYHNSMGLARIETGAREFMCIGAAPPFDHPHIFLDMGASNDIVYPYCSTHYAHDVKLAAGDARPRAAVWAGE